jgi:adenylate cyclase
MLKNDIAASLMTFKKRSGAPSRPVMQIPALTIAERKELRRRLTTSRMVASRTGDLLGRFLLSDVVNNALASRSFDDMLHRLVSLAASSIDAERGTIFLLNQERAELFSRVKQGSEVQEIRIPRSSGIAGAVLDNGNAEIVDEVYTDPRFNPDVDQHTGYRTRSLLCVPLSRPDATVIGVLEFLNKRSGRFDQGDLALVEAIGVQAAAALEFARAFEEERYERQQDQRRLELSEAMSVELNLGRLLSLIIETSTMLLDGERATLFMHDPAKAELWSSVTAGGDVAEIRFDDCKGIAGATFHTGAMINVVDPRSDSRFNPSVDAATGFTTRSIMSVPVFNSSHTPIAVLQVLNSRVGRFTTSEGRRLQAFASQAALALQNAQLVTDLLTVKNYTDGLIRSLPDAVIALDLGFNIVDMNVVAQRLLGLAHGSPGNAESLWGRANPWLVASFAFVVKTGSSDYRQDVEFTVADGSGVSVNATIAAIRDTSNSVKGITIILEDIGRQKKTHATISRYMAKEFAERVLNNDDGAPQTMCATMLFSDIRRFTTITEALSAQGTVEMLNEYFGEMAEIVRQHGGVLDKYIGDAIMAVFGAPLSGPADADNAAAAACDMIRKLGALNQRRVGRGARPLEIGVGLATGEVVAGPVGSADRVNYTVIGDSVNLASRLESANKYYGTSVLAAGSTVERFTGTMRLRHIDLIKVKGKDLPTEIFQILDYCPTEILKKYEEVLPEFQDGIAQYRARHWTRAIERFSAVLNRMPHDAPSWVYTDRCLFYRDHPPPAHWDGVWTMQTK